MLFREQTQTKFLNQQHKIGHQTCSEPVGIKIQLRKQRISRFTILKQVERVDPRRECHTHRHRRPNSNKYSVFSFFFFFFHRRIGSSNKPEETKKKPKQKRR